jgi:hypothetical protein
MIGERRREMRMMSGEPWRRKCRVISADCFAHDRLASARRYYAILSVDAIPSIYQQQDIGYACIGFIDSDVARFELWCYFCGRIASK